MLNAAASALVTVAATARFARHAATDPFGARLPPCEDPRSRGVWPDRREQRHRPERPTQAGQWCHPDLFWGIRGGGANLGIATRFILRLHPVERFLGGAIALPGTVEVVRSLLEVADAAPKVPGSAVTGLGSACQARVRRSRRSRFPGSGPSQAWICLSGTRSAFARSRFPGSGRHRPGTCLSGTNARVAGTGHTDAADLVTGWTQPRGGRSRGHGSG